MPHKMATMHSRAAVHSGFLKSWRANDLHMKVVKMVRAIIDSPHVDEERVKIYVTGPTLYCNFMTENQVYLVTPTWHDSRGGFQHLLGSQ